MLTELSPVESNRFESDSVMQRQTHLPLHRILLCIYYIVQVEFSEVDLSRCNTQHRSCHIPSDLTGLDSVNVPEPQLVTSVRRGLPIEPNILIVAASAIAYSIPYDIFRIRTRLCLWYST
jgi:hypothetical protein